MSSLCWNLQQQTASLLQPLPHVRHQPQPSGGSSRRGQKAATRRLACQHRRQSRRPHAPQQRLTRQALHQGWHQRHSQAAVPVALQQGRTLNALPTMQVRTQHVDMLLLTACIDELHVA